MPMTSPFQVTSTSGNARAGTLSTMTRKVSTPVFMPVATLGAVKTLSPKEVHDLGCEMVISNSFVLSLQPGNEAIGQAGGLHGFSQLDTAIFTDSGGFQVIRDEFKPVVKEEGVLFTSPYDGSKTLLTPEMVVETNRVLAPDVMMVLDDCPPHSCDEKRLNGAVERTLVWAHESLKAHRKVHGDGPDRQLLFAITQGGIDVDLRSSCTKDLAEMNFDGYGIGGLSIGEPLEKMYEVMSKTMHLLPEDKPRYLMGVGDPVQMLECISMGIDVFDSVFPTRNARHGTVFTPNGPINIKATHFKGVLGPIQEGCTCPACQGFSRSFLLHLFKTHETLGWRLATLHNLHFVLSLMRDIRTHIEKGTFLEFKEDFVSKYQS